MENKLKRIERFLETLPADSTMEGFRLPLLQPTESGC